MKRLRSCLINAATAVGAFGVMCLLTEGTARIAEEIRVRHAESAQQRQTPISQFDPALGWSKHPGGEVRVRRAEFDIQIRINARGLRGPDRPYSLPVGAQRVLILGDSFAEGYYVNEEHTTAAVLEGLLNTGSCDRWEVINGGTIAYSTDQEYLFYRTEGERYGARIVVLMFYYNDLYYNASVEGPGGEAKPYFELQNGALINRQSPLAPPRANTINRQNAGVERLKPWHRSLALRMLSNRTIDSSPRLHRFLARFGLVQPVATAPSRELAVYGSGPEADRPWAITDALLAALKRDVEAHGARLIVLYVPARFEVNDAVWDLTRERYRWGHRWSRERVFERLVSVCRSLDVPCVDPRAALRRAEAQGPPAYYTRDVHWTDVGNSVAAHELDAALRPVLGCAH